MTDTTAAATPTIALVGRPNVGKSTLFNRLTHTQDALVADFPGLTRDRQYGMARVGGWPFVLIDTGGLSGEPETLDAAMATQTMAAVREADLVVFIVDGRDGLLGVDHDIADTLRREQSRVLLCVNKIDGIGEDRALLDFYALGFEHVVPTAASHNRGMRQLVDVAADLLGIDESRRDDAADGRRRRGSRKAAREAAKALAEALAEEPEAAAEVADDAPAGEARLDDAPAGGARTEEIRVGFIGRPNVGKSTLVNRLLGESRVIAYDQPGTTRDTVAIPFVRGDRRYLLVDTAGVRKRGKVSEKIEIFSIIKTLKAIEQANVCVLLIDAADGLTEQDLNLLSHVVDKGRALIVAVNKWDNLTGGAREALREDLERRMEFLKFTRVHFISALQGSGVGDLFKSIDKAHRSAFVDLSTPVLTRLLEVATTQHAPPMISGRRIRLRYAHQGGMNPPIIVIHGRQTDRVPDSYRRFLMNWFQKQLKLFGTPLRIEFRQGANPFADRAVRPGSRAPEKRSDKREAEQRASQAPASKKRPPKGSPSQGHPPKGQAPKGRPPGARAPKGSQGGKRTMPGTGRGAKPRQR